MKRFRKSISRLSTGIYIALQLRDGNKEHTLWLIAHKSLGMHVWEQADIDKLVVETLEGTKNERGWSNAKLGANTPLAIS